MGKKKQHRREPTAPPGDPGSGPPPATGAHNANRTAIVAGAVGAGTAIVVAGPTHFANQAAGLGASLWEVASWTAPWVTSAVAILFAVAFAAAICRAAVAVVRCASDMRPFFTRLFSHTPVARRRASTSRVVMPCTESSNPQVSTTAAASAAGVKDLVPDDAGPSPVDTRASRAVMSCTAPSNQQVLHGTAAVAARPHAPDDPDPPAEAIHRPSTPTGSEDSSSEVSDPATEVEPEVIVDADGNVMDPKVVSAVKAAFLRYELFDDEEDPGTTYVSDNRRDKKANQRNKRYCQCEKFCDTPCSTEHPDEQQSLYRRWYDYIVGRAFMRGAITLSQYRAAMREHSRCSVCDKPQAPSDVHTNGMCKCSTPQRPLTPMTYYASMSYPVAALSYEMWHKEVAILNETKYDDPADHHIDPDERPSDRVFLNYITKEAASFCVHCRRDIAKPKEAVIDPDPEDDYLGDFQPSGHDTWDNTRVFARLSGDPRFADL